MKGKFHSNARDRRQPPRGGPVGHFGPGPRPSDRRRPFGAAAQGPKTCPMCGVIVTNLRQHMEARHDDAQSHPRD